MGTAPVMGAVGSPEVPASFQCGSAVPAALAATVGACVLASPDSSSESGDILPQSDNPSDLPEALVLVDEVVPMDSTDWVAMEARLRDMPGREIVSTFATDNGTMPWGDILAEIRDEDEDDFDVCFDDDDDEDDFDDEDDDEDDFDDDEDDDEDDFDDEDDDENWDEDEDDDD